MSRPWLTLCCAAALVAACSTSGDKKAGGGGAAGGFAAAGAAPARSAEITVAAAADLTAAFTEAGKVFEQKTGTKVTFKFGSSGQLSQQIQQGAPFDVFASANIGYADDAIAAGSCESDSKLLYARGAIVIWSKKGGVAPAKSLAELADKRFVKIAIANPEHAPYGKAAKQALESAGVYGKVKDKLVFGENIKQTMQFAETGNAEAAILAVSLAVQADGESTAIDDSTYEPIDQAIVVCKGGGHAKAAHDFVAFIGSDEGRAILTRFGFKAPSTAAAAPPAPAPASAPEKP
jgi:molybdate transport system substrate-binding protein